MRIHGIQHNTPLQNVSKDTTATKQKIEQLQQKIKQIEENKQLSSQEKQKSITDIQKQMERLEKQQSTERTSAISSETAPQPKEASYAIEKRFDTFTHQPKSEPSGRYTVSHDADGTPTIKFDAIAKEQAQPSPNTDTENENKPKIVKTTVNTDAVDREIEKLKQTLQETKQKLASANSSEEKEVLQNQIQALETELKQKDNDTYRRQHMQITEQKEV